MKLIALLSLVVLVIAGSMSNHEILKGIIDESLAMYHGPCPCPYSIMRNGRACDSRSAYSRPGGLAPVCFDSDVTDAMIIHYRARHDHEVHGQDEL